MTACFRILITISILVVFLTSLRANAQSLFANPGPMVTKIERLSGQSLNHVNTIIQDKSGYLWFGSDDGLMRFDGYGVKKYGQELPHKVVKGLLCDEQGNIWIITSGGGLSRFSPVSESFIHFSHQADDEGTLDSNYLNDIVQADDGRLWIASIKGINLFDPKTLKNQRMNTQLQLDDLETPVRVTKLLLDARQRLWFAVFGKGLFMHDLTKRTTVSFRNDKNDANSLESNFVGKLLQSRSGDIWVGTSNAINRFDEQNDRFERYVLPWRSDNKRRRSSVMSMIEDSQGRIWVGSYLNGVNLLMPGAKSVISVNYPAFDKEALQATTIFDIFQDNSSAIWFASNRQGLLKLDPQSLLYQHRVATPSRPLAISALYSDRSGQVWMGANNNLYQWQPDTAKFRLVVKDIGLIVAMDEDNQRGLVMAIGRKGIYTLNLNTETLSEHVASDKNMPNAPGSHIRRLKIDDKGTLWIGMSHYSKEISGGLYSFDPATTQYTRHIDKFTVDAILPLQDKVIIGTRENGLRILNKASGDWIQVTDKERDLLRIWDLYQDKNSRIWVAGNDDGLVELDLTEMKLDFISETKGFPANSVRSITPDARGNLWLGSDKGIVKYHPSQELTDGRLVEVVNRNNGLRIESVMPRASAITSDGYLIFAEQNALVGFSSETLQQQENKITAPKMLLTDFRLHSRAKDESLPKLNMPIEFTPELQLSYDDYLFSLAFSASDYRLPIRVRYAYKMEGYMDDWIETDADNRNATFTSMPAGSYVFKVKSSNVDGSWYDNERGIKVIVTPPWWLTWQAYIAYVLMAITAVFAFVRYRTTALLKQAKALEQEVSQRTGQLQRSRDQVSELLSQKQRMFANISHEFKTPLTLILNPLESMLNANEKDRFGNQLLMMKRNGNRLLRMIEQLLDLSRLEGGYQQATHYYSLQQTLNMLLTSFQPLFDSKNLSLQCATFDDVVLQLKPDALEMILTNLISNAIKYTPGGGSITINVESKDNSVVIDIADSGIGISEANRPLVFNRFTRADENHDETMPGAGIGLALVKELVESHQGTISLQSELNRGSCFSVELPIYKEKNVAIEAASGISAATKSEVDALMSVKTSEVKRFANALNDEREGQNQAQILLIDDNADMLELLSDTLSDSYRCEVAQNGEQGLALAKEQIPDLIIADVMMPGISGYEVAKRLKGDELTCHIPVVLLTAKGDMDSRLQGWQQDIDDYLTKPFHAEELLLRIQSLLSIRQILKKRFVREFVEQQPVLPEVQAVDQLEDAVVSEKDKQFLERFKQVVEENFQDESFNRVSAAEKLFISDRQLARKLSALMEDNFSEYLRRYRLKASLTLFESGMQINEISDKVGFSSSVYFIRCFKAEFGKTPKQHQKQVVL